VSLDCNYSPTCSADHPFPKGEFDALVWTIELSPVEGYAYDANGNLQHVVLDENALLSYVIDNNTGRYASTGEVLAAADSLWLGDPAPLLRLGAEGLPMSPDWGDPTGWSAGAFNARSCVDGTQPWDWSKPVSKRSQQFAEAVEDLPFQYFAPFTRDVATGLLYGGERPCLYWEKPTPSSPVAPPNPTYPNAPALFLTGVMDKTVPYEEAKQMAALFPSSTVVTVAGIGHPWFDTWPQCAINLAAGFIENLQVGDTSCAKTPETTWPAVGRFPLLAKFARPAAVDPAGHNQIGTAERKVVTVAVATATDALQRSLIALDAGVPSGGGVGLRGGTFSTDYGDGSVWTTTLTNCAFSKDVTVNGTVTWVFNGALVADLTVSGSGAAGGTLHVEGTWQAPGPAGNFKISGKLGGKRVAVLVPAA
jgi:pimeloyl-ACP methyl ester carboxylesterase